MLDIGEIENGLIGTGLGVTSILPDMAGTSGCKIFPIVEALSTHLKNDAFIRVGHKIKV